MKFLPLLSLFATLALAQSPSSSTPSGISSTCQDYFSQLISNTTLEQCLGPLLTATSAFTSSTSCPSTASSALNTLCSSSDTCSSSDIDYQLAQFYQACNPELTSSKNQQVIGTYDLVYSLGPFRNAICQKDNSGNYCVLNATSSSAKRASLDRRDSTLVPDLQKDAQLGVPFLGINPNLTAEKLCTPCTRNVMNVYLSQFQGVMYGPGLPNSVFLSGQPTLYTAINGKCGDSFLGGQAQAAGGLATGAAPRPAAGTFSLVGSAISAVVMGGMALL